MKIFAALLCPLLFVSLLPAALAAAAEPGNSPPGISALDRIVAVVNNEVITQSDLNQEVRVIAQQLRQQNRALPPDDVLQTQVLERTIMRQLQLQTAATTGIRVDDDTLNRAIESIAKQNELPLAQFREVLEKDGFDFAAFRDDIRNELIITRLLQREVGNKIVVTDQEVENFLATQKVQGVSVADEYQVAQIVINASQTASDEELEVALTKARKVYDELRGGADFAETAAGAAADGKPAGGSQPVWRAAADLPPAFSDVILGMQPGEVTEPIRSASGFHVIKLFEKRGDTDGGQVKQTQARHILVRTNELTSDQDAELRLRQLKQRIDGGEDFTVLARSNSDDAASAINGGSLGWVSPGDLVPLFEETMNGLDAGQVSEPFQTEFGWHIVQVIERRDHDNTAEIQKSRAREAIRRRKNDEEQQAWLRTLRDEAYVEYKKDE